MAIDPDKLLARRFDPIEHTYSARDTKIYALGVGLGVDPLDAGQLRFVFEGDELGNASLLALPTMANVLAYPGFWAREPDTGIDWKRVVHVEQHIELELPLPTSGVVVGYNRVTGLWDRGAEKGALLQQRREIREASTGMPLGTVTQLNLLRGDGGFGANRAESLPPQTHPIPERTPDVVCVLPTSSQAALLYRLSGDLNPLHADPTVALKAGFTRPILHGMATMGIGAHAVLRAVLNYNTTSFAAMRVRFTSPVYPGDTLRTELWVDDDVVSLRMWAVEREVVVLNNSCVELR